MKLILMTAALVMGAPALAHAPQDMSTTTAQSASGDAAMPGGYEPSQPPMPMQPEPGQKVIFQPSPPVSQAFPPPAPKAEYPVCKRGETDGCRQRGG
ncbi:hypothetical protein [Stakelama pacifica]|uniref:Uncharacterized protein n=1 Tax=Stakelama pacifica TaxID=517720 RepID=A0A4R6FI88_9SPHN|nr:hypothetical protein [Stakelama pacifica]MAW98758.1 hypothetical protein [Sphingomonas sp.]TDN81073.1 hypothetical protein EV664_10814 [Stakelama pacifica]GGO96673.1 hypothetical protein GCM10011329_23720 [Stakelama pacifica]